MIRFNYASADCAARIVSTNPSVRSAPSILNPYSRDTYLLDTCSLTEEGGKFVIIELCQDLLIDTIAIANHEHFAGNFRHIRFSAAKTLKADWRVIGEVEAKEGRGEQSFVVRSAPHFVKLLRVEWLSHYGNEHYCTVSSIRVFGKTMMEDYLDSCGHKVIAMNDAMQVTNLFSKQKCLIEHPFTQALFVRSREQPTASGEDNLFKSLHERLCSVEGRLRTVEEARQAQLGQSTHFLSDFATGNGVRECPTRQEVYGILGCTVLIALILYHWLIHGKSHRNGREGRRQLALDSNQNSDYLGLERTPVGSPLGTPR